MDFLPVTYACGHNGLFEADPAPERRASQIKFYEKKGSCPDCYAKMLAQRDAESGIGCLKAIMSDSEYKAKFTDCKFTKVGITEENKRFVFIPYKRIAADGILVQLGVSEDNPDYAKFHHNIVDTFLDVDLNWARNKIMSGNLSEEQKKMFSGVLEIIRGYQETINKK